LPLVENNVRYTEIMPKSKNERLQQTDKAYSIYILAYYANYTQKYTKYLQNVVHIHVKILLITISHL